MVSPNLGQLGEEFTAQWLKRQGWEIIASRWHCRWGELDLVAYHSGLIFVEVKTRQSKNWDENGLLAITPQKQAKLYRTAEMFLSHYPDYSHVNCRFDLALVKAQKITNFDRGENSYELTLVSYLKGIFE